MERKASATVGLYFSTAGWRVIVTADVIFLVLCYCRLEYMFCTRSVFVLQDNACTRPDTSSRVISYKVYTERNFCDIRSGKRET